MHNEDSYVQGELWPPEAILGVKKRFPVCHARRGNSPKGLETLQLQENMISEHTETPMLVAQPENTPSAR